MLEIRVSPPYDSSMMTGCSVRFRKFVVFSLGWLIAAWLMPGVRTQARDMPLVPSSFTLSEAATGALNAAWLSDEERQFMRVFHGVWDDRDLTTPELRAQVALNAWQFDDPALGDPAVSPEVRGEAALLSGECELALEILENARSNQAARLRAAALETLGRNDEALAALADPVQRLLGNTVTDAGELTEGVQAMILRARLQGQPARDFQTMLNLLGRAHQDLDRLHWPAKLAEAELLFEKDFVPEAAQALHETLALNPRCAAAWYLLGRLAAQRFDFESAATAAAAIRRTNRQHPLAILLLAESRLTQDDPDAAGDLLDPLLKAWPKQRLALAYHAATVALYYDEAATGAALARCDELSPGGARAWFIVGRHLSFARQYEAAATVLDEAIRRAPSWPEPQIELGLMELQSGRDDRARSILQNVAKLDNFNKRAANSLFLLEELHTYREHESEHFIVRYKPGIDEVMAEMMPAKLEEIHAIVSARFAFEPARKTLIEVHPNHERFAVRITGMPFVHTIAACTGPVIALEVPREGPPSKHLGLFDWPRVIQHEYTHTITLTQTGNRLPHWLTEAAAVSMEPGPRTFETCMMLATAHRTGALFNLDDIKWAFVRPKRPSDRSLAYAQGHWMVEFMNERFGESALVRLLERYHAGEREQQAIPNALGMTREHFFSDFLAWAETQIESWGLGATPSMNELTDELRAADPALSKLLSSAAQSRMDAIAEGLTGQIGQPSDGDPRDKGLTADRWPDVLRPPVDISDDQIAAWLSEHPDHPDLLELHLRRKLAILGDRVSVADTAMVELLNRYASLRPVDPFPHKKLAQMLLDSDDASKAIPYLEFLDVREEKSPVYAVQLAKLYRQQGDLGSALSKATRATYINPYHAAQRELVAAIAVEAKQFDVARTHIHALTLIEPDRPQHQKRLAAIDNLLKAGDG